MASIRQLPSGRYNAQIRHTNSKPISKTFDTKRQAIDWVNASTNQEPTPIPEQVILLQEIGSLYCNTVLKGRHSYAFTKARLEKMGHHFNKDMRDITKFDLNDYRLMRLQQVSSVTCRDELQLINRIYRWAHRELILDKSKHPSPCAEITMPPASKPRNRVIQRNELELLISALSPTMQGIVELAYETAMRRGEIVKLKAKHLQLDDRILSVIDGKTGDRSVPLTNRAVGLLRESLSRCSGPESRLYPVTPHSVSTAVRRARKAVGLDSDVRLHQLRHTRITEVAKKGFNQAQIMMVSGHRDVRSVQRYTHLNVRDVINLLD